MASICLSTVCVTEDAARIAFITQVLEQRAKHLDDAESREIITGLVRAELRTGVDGLLLLAMAEEESRFRSRARSRRDALGLLQIRPATGMEIAERHGISWNGEASLFDPSVNLLIGATYLSELRQRFGSWDLALTAYNQGPSKLRHGVTRKREPSSRYAARVLRRFESFRRAADTGTTHARGPS